MIKSEETNNKAMNTSKTSVTVKKSFQKTQSPTPAPWSLENQIVTCKYPNLKLLSWTQPWNITTQTTRALCLLSVESKPEIAKWTSSPKLHSSGIIRSWFITTTRSSWDSKSIRVSMCRLKKVERKFLMTKWEFL